MLTSRKLLTSKMFLASKMFFWHPKLSTSNKLLTSIFFLTSNKLLTSKKYWRQRIVDVKNVNIFLLTSKTSRCQKSCWRQKKFWRQTNCWRQETIDVKKLLTSKSFWRQKRFWGQQLFWRQKLFLTSTAFLTSKKFGPQEHFWRQTSLDVKKTLDVRKTLDAKNLASTICWTSKAFSKDWWGPLFKFARPGGVAHGLLSKLESDSESYFSKFEIWKQDPAKFEIKKIKNWKISKFNVLKVWLLLNTKTKYIWTFCFFLLGLQGGPGSAHLPAFSGSASREECSAHQSSIAWRCLFCFFVRVVLVFLLNLGCSNLCYWIFKRMF